MFSEHGYLFHFHFRVYIYLLQKLLVLDIQVLQILEAEIIAGYVQQKQPLSFNLVEMI